MLSIRSFRFMAVGLTLATLATIGVSSGRAWGHGLIQSPPSRNWFCGAITKPDEVANGVAQFPVCGGAFAVNQVAGYNFMSVLTHTQGRSVVGPRTNVCGFNSETWNGAATVWDQPINWPTSNISSGPQTFTWNISWGPHFSDTQEFRYWITKPGFQFQVGRPLSFDDFEDQPFCTLSYNDANPSGNPDVVPDPAGALFRTRCNVPARSGRQVIYGEWGRNQFTFERFHSCMDVVFQNGPVIDAAIAVVPAVTEFTGAGSITLDASRSVGTGLSYQWSVAGPTQSLYTLTNANQRMATLTLANPGAAAKVVISLVVTSTTGNDSATFTLVHRPIQPSPWFDLGTLTNSASTLIAGNRLSMRVVQSTGQDLFLPSTPIILTAATAAPDAWPFELGQAVNALNGSIRIGLVDAQNQVTPARNATSNHIYALATANVSGAFLQVAQATGTCRVTYRLDSQWGNGFQANLTITNTSTTIPVVGYTLSWTMGNGESFNNGWNATYAPAGQGLSASNTAGNWNGIISPNGNVNFGFVGNKGSAAAVVPGDFRLNGQPCATGPVASTTRATGHGASIAGALQAPPVHTCDQMPGPAPQPARRVSQANRIGMRRPRRLLRLWRRRSSSAS